MSKVEDVQKELEKYLPSWATYKIFSYQIEGTQYYDCTIDCDFRHIKPLKITSTSTTMQHAMFQALMLVKSWATHEDKDHTYSDN